MKLSPNQAKYEKVWKAKQDKPELVLASLLKEAGLKYANYHNYVKKYKKPAGVTPLKKSRPDTTIVIVKLPVNEVVDALRHHKDLIISKDKILNSIEADYHPTILEKVARLLLLGRNKRKDGHATSIDPIEADNGASED